MNVRIEQSWKQQLQEEFDKPYFDKLVTFVKDEYKRAQSSLSDIRFFIYSIPVPSKK